MNTPTSSWSQFLKVQTDTVTSWSRFFNITPNYIFNYNTQDTDLEQHVLDNVGSYGSQLSKVIPMVQLLFEKTNLSGIEFTPLQKVILQEFEDLRDTSKSAVREFRGELGPDDTSRVIKYIAEAKKNYPTDYEKIIHSLNGIEGKVPGNGNGNKPRLRKSLKT